MTDYAQTLRRLFVTRPDQRPTVIIDTMDSREAKIEALRLRMHREKRTLIGEEALAQRMGWKRFKYVPNRDYPEQS